MPGGRPRNPPTYRDCLVCGEPFLISSRMPNKRYCSQECFKTPKPVEDRFWSKVDKTGECWVWTAYRQKFGYGIFHISDGGEDRGFLAHRISWELMNGPIPYGLFVCHHCDNPPCVRPDHLFLGTHDDNMHDMAVKGRHLAKKDRGAWDRRVASIINPAHTKISLEDVSELIRLFESGVPYRELADKYHISADYVYVLAKGKYVRTN